MVIPPIALEARVAALAIHFLVAVVVLLLNLVFPNEKMLCLSSQPSSTSSIFNTATNLPSYDPTPWMFDSGASHHTTMTTASLQHASSYICLNLVHLGNGNSLSISHIGRCIVPLLPRPFLSPMSYVFHS
ncbi:hypothetical protein GQ457_06G014960 [Hibiscus cannabinus]